VHDFKAGRDVHVGGDLVINDTSEQYKLLSQCSTEELLAEREHRDALASKERRKQQRWQIYGMGVAIATFAPFQLGLVSALSNTVLSIIQVAGFVLGIATFLGGARPTEFEQRQLNTLNEIAHLLRERRVE
jgi:hypothetical protein